jgi:cytochrome c oxidase subunit 1
MSVAVAHGGGIADHIHPEPQSFVRKYIFSTDHKVIAVQYFVTALIFLVLGGSFAELIRIQLFNAQGHFVDNNTYNTLYTMHGSLMVWMVTIPLVTGFFGNYVMPLQIGARDVAFPWLNMISYWLFPVAGLMMLSSLLMGAPSAGWAEYPPISLNPGQAGVSMWAASVFLIGVSSTMTALNFTVTIVKMRAPGMTFTRMPLFVWAQLATNMIMLIATTALGVAVAAIFIERQFGVPFFDPAKGGSPVLYQHMFWFYSHPAVYIIILPAFGIISEILPTFARKPIFGYRMIAFSSMAIAFAGFMVWAHHLFTSGLAPYLQLPFMIITYVISVPTGVKIFSWLATLWGGKIRYTCAMLWAMSFLVLFTIGGITGMFLAAVPLDLHLHGSYFVVAHFHFVVGGGMILAAFAGFYYWWPKVTGRMLNETLGKIGFACFMVGILGTFVPMHWLGIEGMPRWVAQYDPQFEFWNRFESISSSFMVLSVLLFVVNAVSSFFVGKKAGPNPWGARTLEWQIASPPPYYNFKHIPTVYGLPYDFGQPLPYKGLEEELTDSPAPVPAGAH